MCAYLRTLRLRLFCFFSAFPGRQTRDWKRGLGRKINKQKQHQQKKTKRKKKALLHK